MNKKKLEKGINKLLDKFYREELKRKRTKNNKANQKQK